MEFCRLLRYVLALCLLQVYFCEAKRFRFRSSRVRVSSGYYGDNDSLSGGEIAAIVIGSIVGTAIIFFICCACQCDSDEQPGNIKNKQQQQTVSYISGSQLGSPVTNAIH